MSESNKKINIVCFADSWDEFERRDMMLLSRLAEQERINRLIYVEPPVTLTSLLKFVFRRADYYASSTWRRIFKTGIIYHQNKKVWIVRPVFLLPMRRLERVQKFNITSLNYIRTWLVKRILKDEQVDVLWISIPHFTADLIRRFNARVVCYSLCEDWTEKEEKGSWMRRVLVNNDWRITQAADIMFVASPELCIKKAMMNPHVHLVPNGVDFQRVRYAAQLDAVPADLQKIPSLRIGHFGFLGPYTDFELLERLARYYPSLSFVLIGPISKGLKAIEKIEKINNIYLLGPKPAQELYSYLVCFDVCIFLYKTTNQNLLRNSMKLYQYLATGKPVISYPIAGGQNIPHLVYMAQTPEEYIDLLNRRFKKAQNR